MFVISRFVINPKETAKGIGKSMQKFDVIKIGTKAQYNYYGELRTGYVKFLKKSSLTKPDSIIGKL